MELILIRHPQPLIAPGICYGASDLPLQPGALQAVLLEILQQLQHLPSHVPLFASPLQRAQSLAQALAQERGALLELAPALRELDFGSWELRAWDEIPRQEVDAWAADNIGCAPGGGESVLEMACRVSDFVDELQKRNVGQAILVCHAGTMRLLEAYAPSRPLFEIAQQAANNMCKIAYGELWYKKIELVESD